MDRHIYICKYIYMYIFINLYIYIYVCTFIFMYLLNILYFCIYILVFFNMQLTLHLLNTSDRPHVCKKNSHGCFETSFENAQATKEHQRWWWCEPYHRSKWRLVKRHRHDRQPHQVTACFWNWCVRSCRDRTAGILSCCTCTETFGREVGFEAKGSENLGSILLQGNRCTVLSRSGLLQGSQSEWRLLQGATSWPSRIWAGSSLSRLKRI